MNVESAILHDVRLALGRFPQVLVRRRTVGTFLAVYGKIGRAIDVLQRAGVVAQPLDVGVEGEPDLDVLVGGQRCATCGAAVHARPVGLEVKAPDGALEKSQESYRVHVAGRRGLDYHVVRSVHDALVACGLTP